MCWVAEPPLLPLCPPDFPQGELLLDLALLGPQGAGGIFYSGDTAQTITAGVGFRFTDVRHMLAQHIERCSGGAGGGWAVGRPRQLELTVNYRTHAGECRALPCLSCSCCTALTLLLYSTTWPPRSESTPCRHSCTTLVRTAATLVSNGTYSQAF